MKIFLIAPANSIHTKRWVKSLAERGHEIFLFSFSDPGCESDKYYSNVQIFSCSINNERTLSIFSKLSYIFVLNKLRKKINEFEPEILHAHYASSYGLLGALTGFHPYVVSVWGSDVYDFPQINSIFKLIIKYIFKKADYIFSTSAVMGKETAKYTNKRIYVTPFGVNVDLFNKAYSNLKWDSKFIIGNVKTLAPKYGIDILIKAFKLIVDRNPSLNPKLVIVGDGAYRNEYVQLCKDLNIDKEVIFVGRIPNEKLPSYYNSFHVAVSTSILNSESFGVVAVEAMSCECPVVVSDADGFTEVVENEKTGLIVPKNDIEATVCAIQRLIDNTELRNEMGINGRNKVLRLYDWEKNVDLMESLYRKILTHQQELQ